jgi:hypothetical protein
MEEHERAEQQLEDNNVRWWKRPLRILGL